MADLCASLGNFLWMGACLPEWQRFRRDATDPGETQRKRLKILLERNAETAFGRKHGFDSIKDYRDYVRRVPLAGYEEFSLWIDRIRDGEQGILTREKVTHFVPTSGTKGPQKLIPFTRGLQCDFDAGIGPWLVDLFGQNPGIGRGPAYWSLTPLMQKQDKGNSAVPIGFESDADYLGGWKKCLLGAIMAVPPWVKDGASMESFRYATLLALLRAPELRLISVWHPSFLSLLLDTLPEHWESLLQDIERGSFRHGGSFPKVGEWRVRPLPSRAKELRGMDPQDPSRLWPELKVISCWEDGAAFLGAENLRRRFPRVKVQGKGLIASEAFISFPFEGLKPLAIRSHFFEFIDDRGDVHLAEALKEGVEYEVVVTTSGGLWRYRLGDRVLVDGFCGRTPSLRFLSRNGNVSDYFGEKLSEDFVQETFRSIWPEHTAFPPFAMLAPEKGDEGMWYGLFIEGDVHPGLGHALEERLRQNPNYDYCRELGQLHSIRIFSIMPGGYEAYVRRHTDRGIKIGDVKPTMLSCETGWSDYFKIKQVF